MGGATGNVFNLEIFYEFNVHGLVLVLGEDSIVQFDIVSGRKSSSTTLHKKTVQGVLLCQKVISNISGDVQQGVSATQKTTNFRFRHGACVQYDLGLRNCTSLLWPTRRSESCTRLQKISLSLVQSAPLEFLFLGDIHTFSQRYIHTQNCLHISCQRFAALRMREVWVLGITFVVSAVSAYIAVTVISALTHHLTRHLFLIFLSLSVACFHCEYFFF